MILTHKCQHNISYLCNPLQVTVCAARCNSPRASIALANNHTSSPLAESGPFPEAAAAAASAQNRALVHWPLMYF